MSYDSPWKEAICRFFLHFLELFFPVVAGEDAWGTMVANVERTWKPPDRERVKRKAILQAPGR